MFKPYQMLLYATPMSTRKRLVQAISKPTPDDTIMVRMVPGAATTMAELSLGHLGKALGTKAEYKYVRFAKASGIGYFPEDMLRYDSAYLYDHTLPEDSHDNKGRHVVTLSQPVLIWTMDSSKYDNVFTKARWVSFGWLVEELPDATLKLERW